MIATITSGQGPLRTVILGAGALMVGLMVLALVPLLLRQTSLQGDRSPVHPARLIPLTSERIIESPEPYEEPVLEPPLPEHKMKIEPQDLSLEFMEPVSRISPQINTPSLSVISLKSLPVQSNPLNLRVNLRPGKAPLPRALPGKPPRSGARFNLDEVDQIPLGISTMRPIYPYRARRLSIEGYVSVRFLVDRTGATRELTILESEPEGVFEEAVKKTLAHWRFKPAQKEGKLVETWVKTTIEFKLEEDS